MFLQFLGFCISLNDNFTFTCYTKDKYYSSKLCADLPIICNLKSQYDDIKFKKINWDYNKECTYEPNVKKTTYIKFSCPANNYSLKINIEYKRKGSKSNKFTHSVNLNFEVCNEYHWYVKNDNILNGTSEIEIWPISSLSGSEQELNQTAVVPSNESKEFSYALNHQQIKPIITSDPLSQFFANSTFFDDSKAIWKTKLYFNEMSNFRIHVSSNGSTLQHHHIHDAVHTLYPQIINFQNIFENNFDAKKVDKQRVSFNVGLQKIRRHPTYKNIAFIYSKPYLMTTYNDFDTYEILEFSNNVNDIVMTSKGIFYVSDSFLNFFDFENNRKFNGPQIKSKIKKLISTNNLIIAFDDSNGFYYSTNSVQFSYFNDVKNQIIDSCIITPNNELVSFLVLINESYYVKTFKIKDNKIKLKKESFVAKLDVLGKEHSPFLSPNDFGHLFVCGKEIFVSTDYCGTFSKIEHIISDHSNDFGYVLDITFSSDGFICVLTSNGYIYLGKIDQNFLIQLQYLGFTNSKVSFDSYDRLYLFSFPFILNQNEIIKYPIPIKSEISLFSKRFPYEIGDKCPIKSFTVDIPNSTNLIYLDKNSKVNVTITIVSDIGIHPTIRASDAHILHRVSTDEFDKFVSKNKTTKTTITSLKLKSQKEGFDHLIISGTNNFSCLNSSKILNIYSGCPKHRTLRVKNEKNLNLFYSKTRFKPELAIYDNNEFISDVDSDFVVFSHDTNNNKIRYCLTAKEAKCKRKPQSWAMFNNYKDWNKSSYVNCFDGNQNDFYEDEPYNILNNTNDNCVILNPKNAKYHFTAIVLDPDYSFCDLSVNFTVNVFGEPMNVWVSIFMILMILLVSFVVIIAIHFYLNIKHKMKMNAKRKKT